MLPWRLTPQVTMSNITQASIRFRYLKQPWVLIFTITSHSWDLNISGYHEICMSRLQYSWFCLTKSTTQEVTIQIIFKIILFNHESYWITCESIQLDYYNVILVIHYYIDSIPTYKVKVIPSQLNIVQFISRRLNNDLIVYTTIELIRST